MDMVDNKDHVYADIDLLDNMSREEFAHFVQMDEDVKTSGELTGVELLESARAAQRQS